MFKVPAVPAHPAARTSGARHCLGATDPVRGRNFHSGDTTPRTYSRSNSTRSTPSNGSRATSTERQHIVGAKHDNLNPDGCVSGMIRSKGLYLDAHQLVLDRSAALDIFKGFLVLMMHFSSTMIFLSSQSMRNESMLARTVCNLGASQCFVGFMMALGYSSYRSYLREWPDPPKDLQRVRMKVLRAIAFPIVGAWICNFAWCFLNANKDSPITLRLVFDVFTFAAVYGHGADFLLGFSINLAIVYSLWRPINNFIDSFKPGTHRIDTLYPQCRRDGACLAIVLSPILLTLVAIPDCTGNMRWAQWLFVCDKRDLDTPTLPALPHLIDFGIGVLVASGWDRFISHLKPVGQGGRSGGLHLLPMKEAVQWALLVLGASVKLLFLFLPLGQVWLYEDLVEPHVHTPVGQLIRGFSGGPSPLWMLATIWPAAVLGVVACVLVLLRGGPLGIILHWPMVYLEHLGANVLYYLVVVDLFLAGMSRHLEKSGKGALDAPTCILCTVLVLAFARFLHMAAQGARK